jgi:phage-related protein
MDEYSVEYYTKLNGECPIRDFIDRQTPKMQAKILRTIGLLAVNGPTLREPHSKKLTKHLFELRCQTEGDQTRVLYFFVKGKRIVLTNGFTKTTQKTPISQIDLAEGYRLSYIKSLKVFNK